MKRTFTYLVSLLVFISVILTQSCTTKSNTYLGFNPPKDTAIIFGKDLFSIEDRYEFAISISPDSKTLLYSVNKGQGEPYFIESSEFVNNQWTKPKQIQFTKGKYDGEMEAFYTPDGKFIYFTAFDTAQYRIFKIDAHDFENQEAENLPDTINDGVVFYPTTTINYKLYYANVLKRKTFTAVKENDTYKIEECKIGLFGHVFISPNESFMLLDGVANKEKRTRDIYVAYRNSEGSWNAPIQLGKEINSDYSETCPSLSPCGKYIFFSRYNDVNEKSDLYWISSSILKRYKD